jgi:hypothetical protein
MLGSVGKGLSPEASKRPVGEPLSRIRQRSVTTMGLPHGAVEG